MIPHIPDQRKFKSNVSKPFDDLVAYIEGDKEQEQGQEKAQRQALSSVFDDILNYATSPLDNNTKAEKCIAIRTHGVNRLATASVEMNAVAKKNNRCEDPAYHVILSWPEHEHPVPDLIFDAAEHALKALGLAEHQYVLAVHGNTDNTHCHISVNRVHPITFRSRNIEWARKTLHMAARQSEIKHGWTHDNGIYIVEIDGHDKKHIVLNNDLAGVLAKSAPHAHRDLVSEEILPTWHDPGGLDSWLKTKVARALRNALPEFTGWPALHAWLSKHDITLTDSGGGGMRLHAISAETGEVLDVAVSKGLRILKRAELEKRWGEFANSIPVPCIVSDLSHLTPQQIAHGVEEVLSRTLDHGIPPEHVIRAQQLIDRDATESSGGQHEWPAGREEGAGQNGPVPLPGALAARVGNVQTGPDQDLRRPGATEAGSRSERSLNRDDSKRAERREQRAVARADLRQRFSHYKRFVSAGDTEHFTRAKEIQTERSQALKQIREQSKLAKSTMPKGISPAVRLIANVEIDAESLRRKLLAEAIFQDKRRALRATRTPPLSWRAWLYEQSNLGDQAALSALRGIVYQAQRDAKGDKAKDAEEIEAEAGTAEYRDQQYRKVMARLLDEEKQEAAIRSANSSTMRPYEADALLARYVGIQWRVTGNGNVEYSDQGGGHLFTDRGNRVTFDRVRVSDDEIRLALVHAQQKFGQQLTLTGDDPVFTARMARLADEMGMTILNPDLQAVIAQYRIARKLQVAEAVTIAPAENAPVPFSKPAVLQPLPQEPGPLPQEQKPATPAAEESIPTPEISASTTPHDRMRAIVLSIDPLAKFVIPDPSNSPHPFFGPVAATLEAPDLGFSQRTGRGVYALHSTNAPEHHQDAVIEVRYRNGQAVVTIPDRQKGKGRAE